MGQLARHDLPRHLLEALRHTRFTVSGSDNAVEPLVALETVPRHVEKALADIKAAIATAITTRTGDILGDERHSFNPLEKLERHLKARMQTWSPTDRATVTAFLKTSRAQLHAYLEDPHPFGASRLDAVQAHAYVANGVVSGRQTQRVSEMSPGMQDFLQHSRAAGGTLLAPHVVWDDRSIPKHLEVPKLKRQFNCPSWGALALQSFFLRLDADEIFVRQYAREAEQRGFESVFIELDWTSLRLAAVGPDPLDRPRGGLVPYEEGQTELGRYAADTDPQEEAGDDDTPTGLEAVEYHPVHGDREHDPPAYRHPLEPLITGASRDQLPDVGKQLYRMQTSNGTAEARTWAYLWHLYRLQELRTLDPFIRWALEEVERITDPRTLAAFGKHLFALGKKFTSNERKLFWAAYKARKAALAGLDELPLASFELPADCRAQHKDDA